MNKNTYFKEKFNKNGMKYTISDFRRRFLTTKFP